MSASRQTRLGNPQDQQLLRAAHGGDAAAWELFVDRHCEFVWSTAVRLVGREPAVVVSELVWLRLASRLGEVQGARTGGARTWLEQAVWDDCAREQRRQQRLHGLLLD